jgi:hypothetical protein
VDAYGYALSCLVLNGAASRGPGSRGTYPVLEKPPGVAIKGPGCMPGQVTMRSYNGLTGGEILPVRNHRDGRKDRCGLLSGLVLFRLVFPPLQLGVVGSYPIEMFSSPTIWCWREPGHNRWPTVPGVQDLDTSVSLYSSPRVTTLCKYLCIFLPSDMYFLNVLDTGDYGNNPVTSGPIECVILFLFLV